MLHRSEESIIANNGLDFHGVLVTIVTYRAVGKRLAGVELNVKRDLTPAVGAKSG
jgi:hypothetical protein